MKILLISMATLFLLIVSCQGEVNPVVGDWKIKHITPVDSVETEDDMTGMAVFNMMTTDTPFSFEEDGNYSIGDGENSTDGTYKLSNDKKKLTLTSDGESHVYVVKEVSDNEMKLQFEKLVITLTR